MSLGRMAELLCFVAKISQKKHLSILSFGVTWAMATSVQRDEKFCTIKSGNLYKSTIK